MFKVRFSLLSRRLMCLKLSTPDSEFEFQFTDSAGDPFGELIDSLVCLIAPQKVAKTSSFCTEPGFVDLVFDKVSLERIEFAASFRDGQEILSYSDSPRTIVLGFWRGLRHLEQEFAEVPEDFWCSPFYSKDLENLRKLID